MTPIDERRAVALCFGQLPEVGSGRTRRLLQLDDPLDAWRAVRAGVAPLAGVTPELAARWASVASSLDLEAELERHRAAGVGVVSFGEPGYPARLADDRSPPGLLVWQGDLAALAEPAAAIVGTRRCTRYGRDVAFEMGAGLAARGIAVVSGLALGIDGAAHLGAVSVDDGGPPVAVVAGGLDRVYPRRHAELWRSVAERGVVLSETPLGVEPVAWRFPARNRIIAALGEVLVVVESAPRGGSMHTVRQADDRGRVVLAVPGSVRSPASEGTNLLLSEGCPPCRDVDDVLVALGLARRPESPGAGDLPLDDPLTEDEALVIDALGATPATADQLLVRTGLATSALAVALDELEARGRVVRRDGWFEVAR